MSKFRISLALLVALSAGLVQAGPFEKAGLDQDAGRKLSNIEADQVRGGHAGHAGGTGDPMSPILNMLGIDPTQSRQAIRQQLRSMGRDAIRARLRSSGMNLSSMRTGGQRNNGWSAPAGLNRSQIGRRAAARARASSLARRF